MPNPIPPDWMLTDMECVVPPTARGRVSRIDAWQIMDYETASFSGTLAMASPNAKVPPLRIPLPLTGRYDLCIGMHINMCDGIRLKLDADRCFDRLRYDHGATAECQGFQEVRWRTVELNGRETLTIAMDIDMRISIGYIAARRAGAPRATPVSRYLVHVTDDGDLMLHGEPGDVADATWQVDHAARQQVDILSLGIDMYGMAKYTTGLDSHRIDTASILADQHPSPELPKYYGRLSRFQRDGICVPRHYFEAAHRLGMQTLGYHRMAHIGAPCPYQAAHSRFYDEHPEWRCIDIDGRPVNRLSYAYPEVRQAFYDLLAEVVQLGANGVNNVYVRGLPAVLYEEPVRQRFLEKHGRDPGKLPENHPDAQAVRAEFVTEYMRGQRAVLYKAAGGKPVTIMATVPANGAICAFYGLDLATWAREGLVDILCPYEFGMLDAGPEPLNMDDHCTAVQGTAVKLLPFLNTFRDRNPIKVLDKALALTRWPIHGFSMWDGILRSAGFDKALTALHSAEGIRDMIAELRTEQPVHHDLIMLDGVHSDKYNFGWNF
ncbi:MAG: hypothetical protein A2498_04875 [Lentisphaerae bacterium RIFOXYC12_FULL_60_16]|nr:MAG: hypothetical protein A2498_04875 [Lentisphaerae bacterium RIFOXYC12_FULL_60_16]